MDDITKKLVQSMVMSKRRLESQKFGDFILQSNKIQFYLSNLVILRSSYPDKEYLDKIESGTLGQIINLFCACAKTETGELVLIPKLRKHNKIRNKFAHKIHSPAKLTNNELQDAISLGNDILKSLILITDKEVRDRK